MKSNTILRQDKLLMFRPSFSNTAIARHELFITNRGSPPALGSASLVNLKNSCSPSLAIGCTCDEAVVVGILVEEVPVCVLRHCFGFGLFPVNLPLTDFDIPGFLSICILKKVGIDRAFEFRVAPNLVHVVVLLLERPVVEFFERLALG